MRIAIYARVSTARQQGPNPTLTLLSNTPLYSWGSGFWSRGDQLKAQGFGPLLQVPHDAGFMLPLIIVLAGIHVGRPMLQHTVDNPCQFVGRSGHRLWFADPRRHAPIVGAERTLTMV